jgi:hypothetical protein
MADYMSPGDAFSSSIAQTLHDRDQAARQAADFALKQQAEARLAKVQQAQLEEAQAALAEKRQEHQAAIDEKERNGTVKDVAAMVPGDIPDADLVSRAQKYHVPIRLTAPVLAPQEAPPQAPAPPAALAEDPTAAAPVNGPAGTGVLVDKPGGAFAGTRQDVEKKKLEDKVNEIRDILSGADPGSPEYKKAILDYQMVTGKSIPAGFAKETGGTGNVARVSPDKGKVEVMREGKWVTATEADLGPGTHWLSEPVPKDTTAHDLAKQTAVGHVYDTAVKELIDTEKPIKGHIDGINGLGSVLAQRTPAADALIAPLVLKATVAGQGSGFRMTRAEIENVLHSRSKWQDLEVALNKWSADPSKALQVTDEQRTDLRTLAKAIRVKANEQMTAITKARHDLDDAVEEGDSMKIRRIRTKLDEDLQKMNDEPKVDDNDIAARADRLLHPQGKK